MNDEATAEYEAIIEQMTLGHEFLYREFQVRPTIGWHIDPFGHASSQVENKERERERERERDNEKAEGKNEEIDHLFLLLTCFILL
jgi:hypothetical protein